MAARGERIGDAYVRIHADGSGLDRQIRDEFGDLDPAMRSIGKDHSEAYLKEFQKGLDANKINWSKFMGEFNKGLARFDVQADFLDDSTLLRDVTERLGRHFPREVGERVADNLRDALQRGVIEGAQGLQQALGNLRPLVARALDEIQQEEEKAADEQRKLAQQVADFQARMLKQRTEETKAELKGLGEEIGRLAEGNGRWGESTKEVAERLNLLRKNVAGLGGEIAGAEDDIRRMRVSLITLNPTLSRVNKSWMDMSDNIGALSGRGSRNNFLNFIGSANRNLSRLFGTLVIGSARGASSFISLAKAIPEFIADPTLLKEVGKNIGSFFSNFAANAVALGGALVVLIASLGVMSALLSGIAAIATALAGTLAFALVGAVGALAGSLVPLVAGIGVTVAAFQSLTDAQKEALKADLKPLTAAFKDLGKSAADVMFRDVGKWARMAAPLIERMKPAVEGVARAIRETLGDAIESASESPAFRRFQERLNTFLPSAVRRLGEVFTNVFEGMGGVFQAMIPLINRFLDWMVKITDEFSEWANSKKGREELRDFFEDAGDSAAALGDFLAEATKFLGELLSKGRGAGDTMFTDMAGAIEDMVEWLQDPKNQASIDQWIEDGKALADAIAAAAVEAYKLIDALDNPAMRKTLQLLIGTFTTSISTIATAVSAVDGAFRQTSDTLSTLGGLIGRIDLGRVFRQPMVIVRALIGFIDRVVRKVTGLAGLDVGVFGLTHPIELAKSLSNGLQDVIRRISSVARSTVGKIGLPSPIDLAKTLVRGLQDVVGKIASVARDTVGNIGLPTPIDLARTLVQSISGIIQAVVRVGQTAFNIPGISVIGSALSGVLSLINSIINAIETAIDKANLLGRLGDLNPLSAPDPGGLPGGGPQGGGPLETVRTTGGTSRGRTILVSPGAIVVNDSGNPRATAQELLNHLAGAGY